MRFNNYAKTGSVYIHWPFCPYRCNFCPFVALASHDSFMPQYHDALKKEIDLFAQNVDKKELLDSVFIGGGTPSTYPDNLMLDMFAKLKGTFDICEATEVTIEVNPGTVCERQLVLWRNLGINRLSIGVQSLNNAVLKKLNRMQSADDVRRLIKQAPHYFDTISVDLILGLPGVSEDEWKVLLSEVVQWPLKHISIYFLTVHESTKLYFDIQREKITVPTDDEQIKLYHWSIDFLKDNGFNRYETSNFARPGYECRHNTMYWERMPYKGFGLGACSFDGQSRFQNSKNLTDYIEALEQGRDCTGFSEQLTPEQIHLEKVMLGLRRSKGLSLKELFSTVTSAKKEILKKKIQWLKKAKCIQEVEGRIVLTHHSFVVQNDIALKLSI